MSSVDDLEVQFGVALLVRNAGISKVHVVVTNKVASAPKPHLSQPTSYSSDQFDYGNPTVHSSSEYVLNLSLV